jgi:hypothetical protein
MTTHVQNKTTSTSIVIQDGSTVSVDAIHVGKNIPKELFASYIPKRFLVEYDQIDSNTHEYLLPFPLDLHFLLHTSLTVDDGIIERSDSPAQIGESFYVSTDGLNITFSDDLYNALGNNNTIAITYTSA